MFSREVNFHYGLQFHYKMDIQPGVHAFADQIVNDDNEGVVKKTSKKQVLCYKYKHVRFKVTKGCIIVNIFSDAHGSRSYA